MRVVPLFLVLGLCAACSGGNGGDTAAATATAPDAAGATPAAAVAPAGPITLRIKDNKFVPAELEVPANTKF
jgi:hypothetical protein